MRIGKAIYEGKSVREAWCAGLGRLDVIRLTGLGADADADADASGWARSWWCSLGAR